MTKKTTNDQELIILRHEFLAIDLSNIEQLRSWFNKYQYLGTNNLAQIAGRSSSYIRRLKKLAGLGHKTPAHIPTNKALKHVNAINVPDNWDDPIWLSNAINIYSVKALAHACGVSRRTIDRRINKYSLSKITKPRSKNKCCNWDWCNHHYTVLGWSQSKCASKAGICQQSFANWLNYFNIPVRTTAETISSHRNVRQWIRLLCNQLNKQPIVKRVYVRSDHIHVRFTNYFWESYYFDGFPSKRRPPFSYLINKEDSIINAVPSVLPEYENETFESVWGHNGLISQPHIIINRSQLITASLIEKRLALHEFCRQITQRGWLWPEYPFNVINSDLKRITNYQDTKFYKNNAFTMYANEGPIPAPGKRIIEHFFDLSDHAHIFKSPRLVVKLLNELLNKVNIKFNTHNMLRIYSSGIADLPNDNKPFRFFNPAAYLAIFKKLGIKGSILDLSPGYGSKAIASALTNIKYFTIPDFRLSQANDRGLADFINLDYHMWDGHNVDLLLYDNNFEPPNLSYVDSFTKYAKRMMIYVPYQFMDDYKNKYKPEVIVRITTHLRQKLPDCLFIW